MPGVMQLISHSVLIILVMCLEDPFEVDDYDQPLKVQVR